MTPISNPLTLARHHFLNGNAALGKEFASRHALARLNAIHMQQLKNGDVAPSQDGGVVPQTTPAKEKLRWVLETALWRDASGGVLAPDAPPPDWQGLLAQLANL